MLYSLHRGVLCIQLTMFNTKIFHWRCLRASMLSNRTYFCCFTINQRKCQYNTFFNKSSNHNRNTCIHPIISPFSVSSRTFELSKPKNIEIESSDLKKGKYFHDFEAEYHHAILENNDEYSESIYIQESDFNNKYQISEEEYHKIISIHDWESKSASDVVTAFISLAVYSRTHLGLPIQDNSFTNIATAFTHKCSQFSDDQLINSMIALQVWPSCDGVREGNFLSVWKCLDDVFYERIHGWTLNKILFMMDLWYHIKLTRMSFFVYKGLLKISNKCDALSKTQIIQTLFYFSCTRKLHPSITIRQYEYYIQKHITHLSIEEIGIVALAFFKIKKKILNVKILSYIMNRVVDELETIPVITLSAIAKSIRYSHRPEIGFMANDFTKLVIEKKKDELNIKALVHLAHINTQVQFFNRDVITLLAERFCSSPSEARLKDIERMLLILSLYNFIPPSTPNILNIIIDQLNCMEHIKAGKQHYLSLLSLLYYLSLFKMFPEDRIRYALSETVMTSNYQKRYLFPMQIVQLEYNRVLEGPPGSKYLLDPVLREYLGRRHSEFPPDDRFPITSKFSAMFKDVIDHTGKLLGKDCFYVTHVLPHYSRADILFRLDESGQPMPIPAAVKSVPVFDDVMPAPDPTGWHAVVIGGRNMYMQNEPRLIGEQVVKVRQLKLLGYTPIVIPSHYWNSEKDKMEYLKLKYFTPV